MSTADAEPSRTDADRPGRLDRGRRGFLTASAVVIGGAGVAAAAACSPSPVEVSARSVQAKLSGSADAASNTAALDAAISESTRIGADVVLPGGEFAFAGMTLPATGAVDIRGAGRGITVLRNESGNPSVTAHGMPGGTEYMSDWSISGLSLTSANRTSDQVGLSVKIANRFAVRDVTVIGHGIGVRHESAWDGGYDGVTVVQSGTAWLFPRTNFAPSSPVGLRNCSAITCDVAVVIENGVEALEWVGGDFSECGRGMSLIGNETRSISLHGLNFERIRGEDLTIGDDQTGPAAIAVNGCRFLRVDKGTVSVRFVRGDALTFTSSRWTNYGTAVEQGDDSGQLVVGTSTGFEVDQFITAAGRVQPEGLLNASHGPFSMQLSVQGPSVLPAVIGTEGVATKLLSGPGIRTVMDDDFAIPPAVGSTAVLEDTDDGSVRHVVRGATGWFGSVPYGPLGRA